MLETSFDAKSTSKNAVWQCFALAGPLKDTINSEVLVRGAGGRLSPPAVSLAIGAWRMHAMSHVPLFGRHVVGALRCYVALRKELCQCMRRRVAEPCGRDAVCA